MYGTKEAKKTIFMYGTKEAKIENSSLFRGVRPLSNEYPNGLIGGQIHRKLSSNPDTHYLDKLLTNL